jgi:hypothetical protein
MSQYAFAFYAHQWGDLTAEAKHPEVLPWPSDVAPEDPPDSAMIYRSSQESGNGSSEPRKHVQPYEQTKLAAAAQLKAQLQAEQQRQAEELAKGGPPCVRVRPKYERVYVARRQEPLLDAAVVRGPGPTWREPGKMFSFKLANNRGLEEAAAVPAVMPPPPAAAVAPAVVRGEAAAGRQPAAVTALHRRRAALAPHSSTAADDAPATDDATKQLQQHGVALHASNLLTEFNQWQQQLPEATGVATSVRTVCYYLTKWGRYYWRQQRQTCAGLQAVDYLVEQLSEVMQLLTLLRTAGARLALILCLTQFSWTRGARGLTLSPLQLKLSYAR